MFSNALIFVPFSRASRIFFFSSLPHFLPKVLAQSTNYHRTIQSCQFLLKGLLGIGSSESSMGQSPNSTINFNFNDFKNADDSNPGTAPIHVPEGNFLNPFETGKSPRCERKVGHFFSLSSFSCHRLSLRSYESTVVSGLSAYSRIFPFCVRILFLNCVACAVCVSGYGSYCLYMSVLYFSAVL